MTPNNVFVYVSAPYNTKDEFAPARLRQYCRRIYEMGYIPICPILMFQQMMSASEPMEYEICHEMALLLVPRCRVLVVCGSVCTDKMRDEINVARRAGKFITSFNGLDAIERLIKGGRKEL